jgi:hypothetical protein
MRLRRAGVVSLIGPIILLALAAWCGVLSLHVEPVGWKWVSLDVPLPVGVGVSRYTFVEHDGGYHSVALRMNRRSGQLETACVFLPGGEATHSLDPKCTQPGAGIPVRFSWQLLDSGDVAASGHFATGDPVGPSVPGESTPTYSLGSEFQLRQGQRYTLILHSDSDLSALAAASPHLVVRLDASGEGPLVAQTLEQIGAFILGMAGGVWGAVTLLTAYRRGRKPTLAQRDFRSIASYAALVLGLVCGAVGSFVGYATSATNSYGSLLRLWSVWSIVGFALLAGSLWLGTRAIRILAAMLLFALLVAGIDPALRMFAIGWAAP